MLVNNFVRCRQRIRKHLLIFSLAAPIGTIVTYFGIGQSTKETLTSVNATGSRRFHYFIGRY